MIGRFKVNFQKKLYKIFAGMYIIDLVWPLLASEYAILSNTPTILMVIARGSCVSHLHAM